MSQVGMGPTKNLGPFAMHGIDPVRKMSLKFYPKLSPAKNAKI